MNRFFLNEVKAEYKPGEDFRFSPEESAHAFKVLRVKPGDKVGWLNGSGWHGLGQVRKASAKSVLGTIISTNFSKRNHSAVHLVQSVLKNKSMEAVIQMCTQAGVDSIWPVISNNSEFKKSTEEKEILRKQEKWKKTAQEACKQSGNPWTPIIHKPTTFKGFLNHQSQKYHQSDNYVASLISEDVQKLPIQLDSNSPIFLWVGPEGDYTRDECFLLKKLGAQFVSLGENVFRSEVAALVMASHFKNILRAIN